MPFPLAHPAAVLPLRHFCPQRLDFPALVIGSLVPDSAYAWEEVLNARIHVADLSHWAGISHLARFSHEFVAGAFGYDLPVGFLMWLVFYVVRRPAIGLLPGRYRRALLPRCRRPAGFPWMIAVSLLIGIWTHLLLDSVTHRDGWIVEHVGFLQQPVRWPWPGHGWMRVNDLLYDGCTFCGVAWLALAYLRWQETTLTTGDRPLTTDYRPSVGARLVRRGCALLLAIVTLVIADACRGWHPTMGLFEAARLIGSPVLIFLLVTSLGLGKSSNVRSR